MRILKTSTYESLLKTIADKEREINKLKLSAQQFEDSSRIAMQQRNDDIKKLSSHCQKLQEDLDQAKQENDVIAKSLDIANEKLDRNKRYQKEAANQKAEEVKQLKSKIKQLETNHTSELKHIDASMAVMATAVEAAVMELATYMRMLPQYKKRGKVEMAKLAQELINSKAKELVDEKKKQAAGHRAAKAENE